MVNVLFSCHWHTFRRVLLVGVVCRFCHLSLVWARPPLSPSVSLSVGGCLHPPVFVGVLFACGRPSAVCCLWGGGFLFFPWLVVFGRCGSAFLPTQLCRCAAAFFCLLRWPRVDCVGVCLWGCWCCGPFWVGLLSLWWVWVVACGCVWFSRFVVCGGAFVCGLCGGWFWGLPLWGWFVVPAFFPLPRCFVWGVLGFLAPVGAALRVRCLCLLVCVVVFLPVSRSGLLLSCGVVLCGVFFLQPFYQFRLFSHSVCLLSSLPFFLPFSLRLLLAGSLPSAFPQQHSTGCLFFPSSGANTPSVFSPCCVNSSSLFPPRFGLSRVGPFCVFWDFARFRLSVRCYFPLYFFGVFFGASPLFRRPVLFSLPSCRDNLPHVLPFFSLHRPFVSCRVVSVSPFLWFSPSPFPRVCCLWGCLPPLLCFPCVSFLSLVVFFCLWLVWV